jgi:hypothetical protein
MKKINQAGINAGGILYYNGLANRIGAINAR